MKQTMRYFEVYANRQPTIPLPRWIIHTTSYRRAVNAYAIRFNLHADGHTMRDGGCYAWLIDQEGHVVGGACSRVAKPLKQE